MSPQGKSRRSWGVWLLIGVPALWMLVFVLVPFLTVLKLSLSQTVIAMPPYTPVLDLSAGWQGLKDFVSGLSFDTYVLLGSDAIYARSYLRSVEIALSMRLTSVAGSRSRFSVTVFSTE